MIQNKKVQNALKRVRERFCQKLSDDLPALVNYYENLNNKSIESEKNAKNILMHVHKISGSAKTFGFPGLSEQASKLETHLKQHIDKSDRNFIHHDLIDSLDQFIIAISKTIEGFLEASHMRVEINYNDSASVLHKSDPGAAKKFSIVVVDDDELINDLFILSLEENMFDVTRCLSGSEVLDFLMKKYTERLHDPNVSMPNLILLDVNLPDWSGYEILSSIKKNKDFEDIPIIMLTRESAQESLIKAYSNGANDYITKPFDVNNVVEKVKHILLQQTTKLLMADDDTLILEYAADYLKKQGYKVFTENNGHDALMTMKLKSPDLVILDITMPGMDGVSALKKAKSDPEIADIPVIIISAKSKKEYIELGMQSGADDYVVKPFDIGELSKRISIILNKDKV